MIEVRSDIQSRDAAPRTGVWAGVDLHGEALRYAAVESYRGGQRRLLRLGRCDFDFGADYAIYQHGSPDHLQTMTEALSDAFSGASVEQLCVIVHPPDCYSFFTPVPSEFSDEEREQRLQEEASLLVQTEADSSLQLSSEALYDEMLDEERVRWYHVLAIEESAREHLHTLLEGMPTEHAQLMLSMQGASRVMTAARRADASTPADDDAPYGLAIGWYPQHVEFSLCRDGAWRFGHFTSVGSPSDCAYFAVALLNRMKLTPWDVGRLYLYGDEVDVTQFDLLQRLFGVRPERLSAMPLLNTDTNSFTARFNPEAYAACIGAAL